MLINAPKINGNPLEIAQDQAFLWLHPWPLTIKAAGGKELPVNFQHCRI